MRLFWKKPSAPKVEDPNRGLELVRRVEITVEQQWVSRVSRGSGGRGPEGTAEPGSSPPLPDRVQAKKDDVSS